MQKKVISKDATAGIYFWKYGQDFVNYAKQMINKNIRVNNEYYVCPVYNEAIQSNKKIAIYPIKEMYGLGTPEDLDIFIRKILSIKLNLQREKLRFLMRDYENGNKIN